MGSHQTHLDSSQEMPEPGSLFRVVRVHDGNRLYESVPAGHEPGWYVMRGDSNPHYFADSEVEQVTTDQYGRKWIGAGGTVHPVISRHGSEPITETPKRRGRPPRSALDPEVQMTHSEEDASGSGSGGEADGD